MRHIIEAPDGSRHIIEGPDPVSTAPVVPAKPEASGGWDRFLTGAMDPIVGAAQIMEHSGIPSRIRKAVGIESSMDDVVRERDANYQAPEGIDWARMGGNIANPVSWAGGGPLKNTLRAMATRGAQVGAVQGALAPVKADLSGEDFALEKAKQAGMGAGGGATFMAATKVAPAVMGGLPANDAARSLMAHGVQPTVGQGLGGTANKVEQQLTAAPVLGDVIQHARNRAQDDFQAVALQRAINVRAPVGPEPWGASTVDEANKVAGHLYESVVPDLVPHVDAISGAYDGLRTALENPRLTKEGAKQLRKLTRSYLENFPKMKGADIKKLDSQIGYDIRRYAAGDPNHQAIADGLQEIQAGFRTGLESGLPADLQGVLAEANAIYRRLIPFNKAASTRADERVLPRALQKASARQARTDSSRYVDELIDSALEVLPNTVPDSGTAGRLLLNMMAVGGGAATGYVPLATSLGAGAVGAVGAARPVQKALLGGYPIQAKARQALAQVQVPPNVASALISTLRGQREDQ